MLINFKSQRYIIPVGCLAGCEMAHALRRLGLNVTIVASRILPKEEQDVVNTVCEVFRDEGIHITNSRLKEAVKLPDDSLELITESGKSVKAKCILIATGRKPDISSLGLQNAKVKYENDLVSFLFFNTGRN